MLRRARIGIRCTGNTTGLADQLAAVTAVSKVILTADSFDAVEVTCADDDALVNLVDQELRVLPGVLSMEIMVFLRVLKQYGRTADARLSQLVKNETGPSLPLPYHIAAG